MLKNSMFIRLLQFSLTFSVFCFLFNPIPVVAEGVTPLIPEDFKFQGKPISAFCLEAALNTGTIPPSPINLDSCTAPDPKYILETADPKLVNKGFMGYQYTIADTTRGGYVYYKYLGKVNNNYIIYLLQNGGGSSLFSYVYLVSRNGNTIQLVRGIVGGDRCNGGINEIALKDSKLFYSINITPFDYLTLARNNPQGFKAYDDLASCAACCQGTAIFENNFTQENLIAVNLGDPANNEQPVQGTYQRCFNNILNTTLSEGKQKLSPQEFNTFVQTINNQCIRKKNP